METTNPNFKIHKAFAYSGGDISEPIGIHIIKSGWCNPQLYHVLIEFGDMDQTDHYLLSKEQIQEKWNLEFDEYLNFSEIVKSIPNDQELGKFIRLQYTKTQN